MSFRIFWKGVKGLEDSIERRSHFRLFGDPAKWSGWKKIFLRGRRDVYPKGAPIVLQGEYTDRLYYIVSGIVEYTHTDESGVETLVDAMGSDNVVGLQPFFQKAPAISSFVALTDVVTASLDQDVVRLSIDQDCSLAMEIVAGLCSVVKGLVGHNITTNTTCAKFRAVDFICALCETDMSEKRESGHIFICLSQYELARVTKTTRVTIAKVLRELKAENYLETTYGGVFVKDYDGLKKFIETKGAHVNA